MTVIPLHPTTTAALTPLTDLDLWARTSLLEAVALVLGAVLITRFATWLSRRITVRIDTREADGGDVVVRSEQTKHRHAVTQVLTWFVLAVVYCVTAALVAARFGVPLSGFVAPATVLGVALGFGAQRIVQDVLAGFFLVTERQYGFGDVVRLAVIGTPEPAFGTVEEVTLRITRIRALNGEVVTTPNGQIVQVTNLSRDWARAVVDVPVPADLPLDTVTAALRRVGQEAFTDPELHALLLDAPTVMGVEQLEVDRLELRVVARTQPGRQFDVSRALRARASVALAALGRATT